MDAKKIGWSLLVLSIILVAIFVLSYRSLAYEGEQLGCFSNKNCQPIQKSFSLLNVGFGFFGFIVAFAVYLIFFPGKEQELLQHLTTHTTKMSVEEKLSIFLLGLDEFEKKAVQELRKQDGISQSTLRLRTDFSKAKLSQVLTVLEKKGIIVREPHKKTLLIHWKLDF